MRPGGGRDCRCRGLPILLPQPCLSREMSHRQSRRERRLDVSVLCSSDKILGLVCLGEKQEVVDLGCNPTGKD